MLRGISSSKTKLHLKQSFMHFKKAVQAPAGTHIRGCVCTGTPKCFQSRSKIFLINEKSVHDTVQIQIGPTSGCFRQRSVHEDDWKFYKQCSTVIRRVVLTQSRGRRLKKIFPYVLLQKCPILRLGKAIIGL